MRRFRGPGVVAASGRGSVRRLEGRRTPQGALGPVVLFGPRQAERSSGRTLSCRRSSDAFGSVSARFGELSGTGPIDSADRDEREGKGRAGRPGPNFSSGREASTSGSGRVGGLRTSRCRSFTPSAASRTGNRPWFPTRRSGRICALSSSAAVPRTARGGRIAPNVHLCSDGLWKIPERGRTLPPEIDGGKPAFLEKSHGRFSEDQDALLRSDPDLASAKPPGRSSWAIFPAPCTTRFWTRSA